GRPRARRLAPRQRLDRPGVVEPPQARRIDAPSGAAGCRRAGKRIDVDHNRTTANSLGRCMRRPRADVNPRRQVTPWR
ncbi:MAG: hypothetical protein ACOC95_08580, partial [Planctomycetota bacterium]